MLHMRRGLMAEERVQYIIPEEQLYLPYSSKNHWGQINATF